MHSENRYIIDSNNRVSDSSEKPTAKRGLATDSAAAQNQHESDAKFDCAATPKYLQNWQSFNFLILQSFDIFGL
jgi:hypothetical protein